MLWVVTLSVFLPSFTSSSVVCAHPSEGQNASSVAHSQIFFMIGLPWSKPEFSYGPLSGESYALPPLDTKNLETEQALKGPREFGVQDSMGHIGKWPKPLPGKK